MTSSYAPLPQQPPAALAEATEDFGHLVHRRPRAVFRPDSAEDVAATIGWAVTRGLHIAARGQGHSTYGRSMVDDGIVLDMRAMARVHEIAGDRIVVDAGVSWSAVIEATLPRGLVPPVLTNYLELSVGGTLAIGGIGGTSFRHGMQTDNVSELEVVTGDGRALTASAEVNPDLFEAVRAGLGQSAVITRAGLRLVRAPQRIRRFHLFYADLGSLAAAQQRALSEARFDHLQGAILPAPDGGWRYQLEGVVFYDEAAPPDEPKVRAGLSDEADAAEITDLSFGEDIRAFAHLEALLRGNGQWGNPRAWLLTFLPGRRAEQIAVEIVAELSGEEIGPFGRITFYPVPTAPFRTPLVRLPEEDLAFVFNLVRMPVSSDGAAAAAMVRRNRTLYERIRDAGGVLYPVSALPMSSADWRAHFGPRWLALEAARRRYDPHGVLTPGYELF